MAMARAVCRRVAQGEALQAVCAEPGMPHRASLYRWVKAKPRFGEMMRLARQAAARSGRAAQLSTYCPVAAAEICERMAEGETLAAICRDPLMPAYSTVHRWRRTFAAFARDFQAAREALAHRLVDEGLEIAGELPAGNPYAAHVRLTQVRWTAQVWAPHAFRVRQVEPAKPPEPPREQHLLIRHFQLEMRETDGALRVVEFQPSGKTGKPVRVSAGEWELPSPGKDMVWVQQGTDRQVWPPPGAAAG
jgi:hypothetical protein